MRILPAILLVLLVGSSVQAQATRPATRPAVGADVMRELLKPAGPSDQAIPPILDRPMTDSTSGAGAVAPAAPTLNLIREGTYITNRIGRLSRTADGQMEFGFVSDQKTMQDPPMGLLPNQLLMQMESAASSANRELKFRVTGMVTEYRGRNYLLLQKVVVVPDSVQQF